MSAPQKMVPLREWVASGFDCCIVRAPIVGAINGYVRVPGISRITNEYPDVDVHGGVTFGPDDDDWIGFDTLHWRDWWPGMREARGAYDRTWTEDQVVAETERMAANAKALVEVVSRLGLARAAVRPPLKARMMISWRPA